jgi:TPR repeat protein
MKYRNKYCVAILILCASLLYTVHAQQAIWGKSPKELFGMIGNPQVDLSDQGSAYRILENKPSGDPSMWRAGDTNSIEGAYYLAECYVSGKTGEGGPDYSRNQKGFPPNRPEAFELAVPLYEKAAYYDYLPSLVKLSAIYADEKYAGKNLDKSLTYLIKAAKLGDKDSLDKLASLYSSNFPGVSDENQKYMGMELLANNGNPEAQVGLSKVLISKNSEDATDKAKGFLIPLAEKGNVSAVDLLAEVKKRKNAARIQAEKIAANEALQKAPAKKQQIAEAQKTAAAAAQQRTAAAKQQPAEVQKVVAEESLQKEGANNQDATSMTETVVIQSADQNNAPIFWIAFSAILILATIGTILGVKDKVVVYNGKSDVKVSFLALVSLCMFLGFALDPEIGGFRWLVAALGVLLLILFARRSYLANQKNVGKTIVVVPTKLVLPSLVVFSYILSLIFLKYAISDAINAHVTPRYTKEQREQKLQHQVNAAISLGVAGLFAYVARRLQGLIKKLVKENSKEVSKPEIIEAEIVE